MFLMIGTNIVWSASAYTTISNIAVVLVLSLTIILMSNGPKTEPWRTLEKFYCVIIYIRLTE